MLSRQNLLRLSLILSVVAILLTFSAALLHYRHHGEIRWQSVGGGALCCLLAANAWSQLRQWVM